MHPLPIINFFLLLLVSAPSQQVMLDEGQEPTTVVPSDEDSENWEYEPRIWSPVDIEKESSGDSQDFNEELEQTGEQEHNPSLQSSSIDHIRRQSNFLSQSINLKKGRVALEEEDQCTQFRLDTREAVVCDKRRCDKFDFEWPSYDNQIAWIQTTKHGMRFHRGDLAFAPKTDEKSTMKRVEERGKVPFQEIFDFFKPKPELSRTTTAASTTTAAPNPPSSPVPSPTPSTTTTSTATTPTQSTDFVTSPASTTTTSTTTTTDYGDLLPIPILSTTKPSNSRDVPTSTQDSNSTQLVTTFRLDTRRPMQKIIGFGGALSDATCRNIRSLSPQMAKSLMDDYFGDRGLKYNIARLTIGSSDFSTTPYTNNDQTQRRSPQSPLSKMATDEMGDVEMKNFHLTDEDYEFKLPIVRQAVATSKHELKFFASLWSPPIWMKNNSHIVHGYLKGDIFGPYYKGLAELMVRWMEAYRRSGVELWGMTGLNEPVTGVKPFIFHNSLGITRDDYVTFFKLYLGPMLRQRGFPNVKLIMLDDNKGYAPNWVNAMLHDSEVAKYISGIGIHWYMNDEYENLNFIPKKYPDKFIMSTEACNGFLPFQVHAMPGNWDRGVAYMYDIIKTTQKNSAAWVDWNMALDLGGGPSWAKNNLDSPIIVNARRDEYYKSPMFYAMGHFSKFVEPNSTRLDYRIANANYDYPVEAVAFLTPRNYIVIVAMNSNRHQVPFKVIVDRQVLRVLDLKAESFNTIVFKWKPRTT